MRKTIILEVITVLYIILFLYTGISKIMDFDVFKEQIATSPILSPISNIIAVSVPLAEVLVIILLIIPKWRLKGLWASLIVMALFTGYIIAILSLSDKLPCSCGGIIELMSWSQHIIFNLAFLGLAIAGIALEKKLRIAQRKDLALIEINNSRINPQAY